MHDSITIPIGLLSTFKDPATLRFFLWCLVKATTVEITATVRGQALILLPGQFLFSRRQATIELEDFGLTERKIRTALNKCIASHKVSHKVSHKITILTVINFGSYRTIEGVSVPQSVPLNVPETGYKTRQTESPSITKNAKNKGNTNNKVNYPKIQDNIALVFKHYRQTFPTFGRTVRPGHKDWKLIGDRLTDGYTVEECIEAISGNSVDEWYNAKGLHSIRYIFRDPAILERFVLTWKQHCSPKISDKTKRGIQASQSWLARKENLNG